MGPPFRVELKLEDYKSTVLPLYYGGIVATGTGLEPAIYGLKGRRVNQIPLTCHKWWARLDLNQQSL